MLPAMPRDEILAEIVERPREAYVPLPDLQVIERPGWRQLVTPSFKHGGFNEVSFARLADAEADAVIDATIAHYAALGCKFVWRVGPDSAPADLPDRLARRGLVHVVSCGMARTTELPGAGDPRITVDEVDAATVGVYTRTMAEGWDMDPGPLATANELVVRSRGRHHLFLARYDGEPAATAGAVVFERSIYLLGGVTLPRYRGRGLYGALVAARLTHARARGVALATSHAIAATSAPILERLGFETLCRYDNFTSS